jgi:hypothetical protein
VTLGSWLCDIAVPLGPHSNAVDKIAIAEGAKRLDEDLMTASSQIHDVEPSDGGGMV